MEMTIDNAISAIEMGQIQLEISQQPRSIALDTAISIMRKYQRIEKIINAPIGGTSAKYNAIVNLIKYSEVNNDNRTS